MLGYPWFSFGYESFTFDFLIRTFLWGVYSSSVLLTTIALFSPGTRGIPLYFISIFFSCVVFSLFCASLVRLFSAKSILLSLSTSRL